MFEDDLDSVADALDVMMTRAAFEAPKRVDSYSAFSRCWRAGAGCSSRAMSRQ